jgi:hypothetical protein
MYVHVILYVICTVCKLARTYVVWSSVTSADTNKAEYILQKFSALLFERFFPQVHDREAPASEQLNLHTLSKRRHHIDQLFHIQCYLGSTLCPSVLEAVGIRVPVRYIRDFSMFIVSSSSIFQLYALQMLMLFAGTLAYLEPKMFLLIILYNLYFLIINY